jgi:hypothetical protein
MKEYQNANGEKPVIVNLPDGQNEARIYYGEAPRKLDEKAPVKVDISGTIHAPLRWLEKRVGDIDQHKAHILVNRDKLAIVLMINEDNPYTEGRVRGQLELSNIFQQLGINNSNKQWQPEQLGNFLKLNRTYFPNKEENREVVNALKTFSAKVNQDVQRESKENGNRALVFRQAVDSNIPSSFHLCIPIFAGESNTDIDVETYASVDGADVSVNLLSAGAIDAVEDVRNGVFNQIIDDIRAIAPEIVIIEQ